MWRWDREKTNFVRKLYQTHSASVIAIMINERFDAACTRNSVIGITWRMKMRKGAGVHPSHELKQKRPKRGAMMNIKPEWKPLEYKGPRVSGIQCPCQVVDLEQFNCRWPYGDPREEGFHFCGAVVVPEGQYCPAHTQQAFHT
jgi:hypothetical protein